MINISIREASLQQEGANIKRDENLDISQLIKDYHWMMKSIKLLKESVETSSENISQKYGIDNGSDKKQVISSFAYHDSIFKEGVRKDKRYKKIVQYEEKLQYIQDRLEVIKDDRELEVLHWMLEGKSYRWIAEHMGLSHSHIARIKEAAINKMGT